MKSKMNEEKRPFFVYGTLLPGQPNAYLWGEAVVVQETAVFVGGRLYDMGSYPVLIEGGEKLVSGMVMQVAEAEYDAVLARLDVLEGCDSDTCSGEEYRRVVREVKVVSASSEQGGNGRSLSAWVYLGYEKGVRGLLPIPGGDWAAYVAKTFQDSEQWWKKVASVHRLPDE